MIRRGADLEAQNALFIVTALGPADIVETWPFSGQRRRYVSQSQY